MMELTIIFPSLFETFRDHDKNTQIHIPHEMQRKLSDIDSFSYILALSLSSHNFFVSFFSLFHPLILCENTIKLFNLLRANLSLLRFLVHILISRCNLVVLKLQRWRRPQHYLHLVILFYH